MENCYWQLCGHLTIFMGLSTKLFNEARDSSPWKKKKKLSICPIQSQNILISLLTWNSLIYISPPKSFFRSCLAQMVKRLSAIWETQVWSLGWEDLLEKEMATHSSIPAWRILGMEEPGRLQSMGSQRVGHNSHFTSFHFTSSTHLAFLVSIF